jgi:Ser/Thr protein kinase RdoA (MazF antagonist)
VSQPAPLFLQTAYAAWTAYGDRRRIVASTEVSANVSTNHVYRLALDDGSSVIAKVSSYGSYYLFREDHDRLNRCQTRLQNTRFANLLADVLTRDGKAFTYQAGDRWVAFYQEVPKLGSLPDILTDAHVANLATELAEFHLACHRAAGTIPPSATSLVSDIIYLLDLLSDPSSAARFHFSAHELATVRRHGEAFLEATEALGYDEWTRIPVLVDWNLGNFSVESAPDGDSFRLATRWDYDWFRIEPRQLDFYFLSRVSSATGDRTVFTYGPHTLLEPRFAAFLRAYSEVFPLTENELRFIPEMYRFFILNYVIRLGAGFFQPSLCTRLQRDAVTLCLPALDSFNVEQLLDFVR